MSNETEQLKVIRNFQMKIGDVLAIEDISVENFKELNGTELIEPASNMHIKVISFEPEHYNKKGNIGFMLSGVSFGCWLKTYFKDGSNLKSSAYGRGYAYLSASVAEEKHHTRYNIILDEIEIKPDIYEHRQENLEAHYGLAEWRLKEMYRRAYPSIDISKKEEWMFKDEKGETWLEPTHFFIKREDYEELFKCDGDFSFGLQLVFSSPSRFDENHSTWVAMKIMELFRYDYTEKQRRAFIKAWFNLLHQYEDFDWYEHFEKLGELMRERNIELPNYAFFEDC